MMDGDDKRRASSAYELLAQAMIDRKQVLCTYNGYSRELCPILLGHTNGQEKALAWQFAGGSETGLPPGGNWRCLYLSEVREVQLRDGPWYFGDKHSQPQSCVRDVDRDVNPESPYSPKRPL